MNIPTTLAILLFGSFTDILGAGFGFDADPEAYENRIIYSPAFAGPGEPKSAIPLTQEWEIEYGKSIPPNTKVLAATYRIICVSSTVEFLDWLDHKYRGEISGPTVIIRRYRCSSDQIEKVISSEGAVSDIGFDRKEALSTFIVPASWGRTFSIAITSENEALELKGEVTLGPPPSPSLVLAKFLLVDADHQTDSGSPWPKTTTEIPVYFGIERFIYFEGSKDVGVLTTCQVFLESRSAQDKSANKALQ